MQVKCRLCGGENKVLPGQKMLFCSYCGSALALEEEKGPEHLILPHKRNDRNAEETLVSFFLSRNRPRPREMTTEFSFVPYLMIESEKGQTSMIPAAGAGADADPPPYPPAGNYRFFDEEIAASEKIIPIEKVEKGTLRILHLPIYRIRFGSKRSQRSATVVGGSWQVVIEDLPAGQSATLNMTNLIAAAGLFAIFLFIGKAVPSWPARMAVLFGASTLGFTIFNLRERMAKRT